jgi:type II secretory pathway pseudopilin PulG
MARSDDGFLVVEALVAIAIAVVLLASIAQFGAIATTSNRRARELTIAALAARRKVEELRALAWGVDAAGQPLSDPGLSPTPPDSLVRDVEPYCDYLGSDGESIASGNARPPAALFTRRWSITPLADAVDRGVVVQVAVIGSPAAAPIVRLVDIRMRKAP